MRDLSSDLPITFTRAGYAAGAVGILSDINLEIGTGMPTALLGPNGSGKTTLLRLAMGLLGPTAGKVTFAHRTAALAGRLAIVFQRPVMLRRSAAANVGFALRTAGRACDGATVSSLLQRVGLAHVAERPARRLSAGEQQRLALARALARDPEVLFLDEPTANLDPAATKTIEDIITQIAAAGVKIVLATHDLGQARRVAGDVVFLAKGRLIEHTPSPKFFTAPSTYEARRFLAGELVI